MMSDNSIKSAIDGMGIPESEFDAVVENVVEKVDESQKESTFSSFDLWDWLRTETGADDDYINHPLNFSKSEGLGQMIRGVTGFFNRFLGASSLRLAILDVVFGFLKFKEEPKKDGNIRPTA